MKTGQLLLVAGLVVAVAYTYMSLSEAEKQAPSVPVSVQLSPGADEAAKKASEFESKKSFSELVSEEAGAVARLTDKPDEVHKRLKDLASQMKEEQVDVLKEKALNTTLNGDERFLSVYVLGESALQAAQEGLEAIAAAPIPKLHDARMTVQEEIIRGQAIESLREPDRLRRIFTGATADNKFLMDRVHRTLNYRQGKVSSPEKQDQEILGKILEKGVQ